MAKKRALVKTSVALESFTVGGNLNVDDVLVVVTSQAEEFYAGEIERCRYEASTVDELAVKLQKAVERQTLKEAVAPHKMHIKVLQDGVRVLGGIVKLVAENRLCEGKLQCKVAIRMKGASWGGFESKLDADPSPDLLEKMEVVEEKLTEANSLRVQALWWKRRLQNVPMLERKYKRQIAEQKLSENVEGRELLALLTRELQDEIENLSTV